MPYFHCGTSREKNFNQIRSKGGVFNIKNKKADKTIVAEVVLTVIKTTIIR